jgi:hypothetical protein
VPGLGKDLYWVACSLAGEWRRGYLPDGVNLLSAAPPFPRVRRGVYIACDRTGRIVYVGKVTRADARAVRARVFEHVRDDKKAYLWATIHVVPLRDDTPTEVVAHLEGVIGRRLMPATNRRLPRPLAGVPTPTD